MATDDDDVGSAPTMADTEPGLRERTSSSSIAPPLPSVVAGRYEILGLLGAGGMGRVYRAHDRSLDETIALKILRRDLVDLPGALERFRQEVKLARRVTSPHVVRTFDLGEHGDDHFLTMEYIDGRSLAQTIEAGAMRTDDVLRIARAACAGMAAAHSAGILHRDLKPDNILIGRDGRIAITDFGIARAHGDPTATGEGFIGTPAYMAPEQVTGTQTLGPAVDVYAFGAILYEMLTGVRAWRGNDPLAVAVSRLHHAPPDPRQVRDVPDSFATVVLRCLARDPGARFADANELAKTLATITDVSGVDVTMRSSLPVPARTSRAVALLPLKANEDLADIAEGLSEEIVDALTMTRDLRIVPLSSVRATLRDGREPALVGKALKVDVVVDGSLRKRGDKVRITARAIGVVDGFQLWANHFDTAPDGLLAASDEVARAVARALTVEIELPARAAPNAQAIELYLEAKAKVRAGWFDIALRRVVEDLEEAHRLAPDDASILATLAMALARVSFLTPEIHLPRARMLAERAVAVAPQSGEAWLALGFASLYANAAPDAARAFSRAVRHAPGLALAQATLGAILLESGAVDEAIVHLEAAASLDALHPPLADLPRAYIYASREAEGIEMLERAKETRPGLRHFARVQIARFKMWRGELFELFVHEDVISTSMGDFARYAQIIATFHSTGTFAPGDRAELEHIIKGGSPRLRASMMQFMAEHLMFEKDLDAALEWVRLSVDAGLQDLTWMERCPMLEPLRARPEFQALAQAVTSRAQAVLVAARGGT